QVSGQLGIAPVVAPIGDFKLPRHFLHRLFKLIHAVRQVSQTWQNTSVTAGGCAVHRIDSTSTTYSASPLGTHNRFTAGKTQRAASRGNKIMHIPTRRKPRQDTAACVAMPMTPHDSQIITITRTVVT